MNTPLHAIGLMSGTSMDGIDAAYLQTNGEDYIKQCGACSINYPIEFQQLLKACEYALMQTQGNLKQAKQHFANYLLQFIDSMLKLSKSNQYRKQLQDFFQTHAQLPISFDNIMHYSTLLHAEAVQQLLKKIGINKTHINVIGYHGQTLYHHPQQKLSIQAGDGQLLADITRVRVVNNFRQHDLLHGGQGAPLAPIYHWALANRDQLAPCAIINCGGIANVTFLNDHNPDTLLGFDTGPGNCLIDQFVRSRTNGQSAMDEHGHFAQQGQVDPAILTQLYQTVCLQNHYFQKKPPKSLDTYDFILPSTLDKLSLEDGCATLTAFTAHTIAESIHFNSYQGIRRWIMSGGGAYNQTLLSMLTAQLTSLLDDQVEVMTPPDLDWSPQSLEAELMAYLAVRHINQLPFTFPATTGVTQAQTGGVSYWPAK